MSVVDEVREAYADSWLSWDEAKNRRNLDFKASAPLNSQSPEFAVAVDIIGDYNSFSPRAVARILSEYDADVTIAREGSPALYISPRSHRYDIHELVIALHDLSADEISVEDKNIIRAWWD